MHSLSTENKGAMVRQWIDWQRNVNQGCLMTFQSFPQRVNGLEYNNLVSFSLTGQSTGKPRQL